MKGPPTPLFRFRTHSSIQDIPREQWDNVWPRLTEGYDFYRSQEEAGIEGFTFRTLALYAGDALALVAPLFVTDFNMGLALGPGGRRRLEALQRLWPRLLVLKTLFCGSPTSEKGLIGIAPAFRHERDLLPALDGALRELARGQRARLIVFKDFLAEDAEPLAGLASLGYVPGNGLPTACLDVEFDSLDAYLERLHPSMRKDLRRKLKTTEGSGVLQIEEVNDVGPYLDEVHALYTNVYRAGGMHFEFLTKAYFHNISRYMSAESVIFLYWMRSGPAARRQLVGFNLCFQFEDRLIDKYIGLDYRFSRDLNLYFVSFLHNVRWCIEHKKKIYMLSQGEDALKVRLGARRVTMHTFSRFLNPVVHGICRRFF